MTTVLCCCRVADFDACRPGYDRDVEVEGDLRSYTIWRGQDDPNRVVIAETFDSREMAEAVWTSPAVADAMRRDGGDIASVQIEYVDRVASKTR
jgi:quinol monooxygenase YgiN